MVVSVVISARYTVSLITPSEIEGIEGSGEKQQCREYAKFASHNYSLCIKSA